jgi:hypothetical protein
MRKLVIYCYFGLSLMHTSLTSAQNSQITDGAFTLHLNGVALHFEKGEDINEANWGLGFEKTFDAGEGNEGFLSDWEKFWEFDAYKDSHSDLAFAAGVGMHHPGASHFGFGLKAGLVYEKELEDDAGSPVLPYLLPFVETHFTSPVNLRATLIPPLPPFDLDGSIIFQLLVNIP